MLSQMKNSEKKSNLNPMRMKTQKVKAKKSGAKKMLASTTRGTKKAKSKNLASDFHMQADPSHAAGHKKMNMQKELGKMTGKKTRAQSLASLNQLSPAENIRRKESPQRRMQYPNK